MKKSAANPTTPTGTVTTDDRVSKAAAEIQKLHIGREIVDTTWRIAVPVLLFAGIGIALDLQFDTAPWLTLLGVVIGFGFATLLIKRLLQLSEDDTDA